MQNIHIFSMEGVSLFDFIFKKNSISNKIIVENITYLCTKVNIENGTSPKSGCFKEIRNNRVTEVCVCEPQAGRMPCNSAISSTIFHNLIVTVVIIFVTYELLKYS